MCLAGEKKWASPLLALAGGGSQPRDLVCVGVVLPVNSKQSLSATFLGHLTNVEDDAGGRPACFNNELPVESTAFILLGTYSCTSPHRVSVI